MAKKNAAGNLVSILIPNFNKEEFLPATLSSILAQEYGNWECILVDDGSSDSSVKILNEYAGLDRRFKVFIRPNDIPKGANYCRNYAFGQAKGDYIQWFDSDDIMFPWFLKMKVDYLESQPTVPFVVSKGELIFDEGFEGNRKFAQNFQSENPIEDYLNFRILFFTGGPLFRKEVFHEVGLFNGKLKRHQEWELFLRVVLRFQKWGKIGRAGFSYVVNSNSITSGFKSKNAVVESELAVFKVVLGRKTNRFKAVIPKKIRLSLAFKYFLVASYHRKPIHSFWYFRTLVQDLILT